MSDNAASGDREGQRRSSKIIVVVRGAIDSARQMMRAQPFGAKVPPDLVAAAKQAEKEFSGDSRHLLQVIAAVATAIWRARTKLEDQPGVELPSELRHLPRHIQAAWDALVSGGIEVQDPKGQRYVPGMAVNPLTFQPVEGLGSEVIHETIKPTVFYNDLLIQRADVIVGQPIDDPGAAAASGLAGSNITVTGEPASSTAPDGTTSGVPRRQQTNPIE